MALRYKVALGVIAGLFALSVLAGLVLNAKLASLNSQAARTRCDNALLGDFVANLGRAFATPPAPNDARDAAVTDLIRAAERIRHSDQVCAHGVPEPLEPTRAGEGS